MKTILRIIIILLVAAIVAAGFSLVVNNTSIASGPEASTGRQAHGRPSDGGQMHLEGGRGHNEGASLEGLMGVLGSLAKLSAIAALVLLVQKGFSLLVKRKPAAPQSA